MGELREISKTDRVAAAQAVLKQVRHGLLGKTIKPDGMVVMWFTDEGGVEYEQGEGLSLDQVISLAALVQAQAVQEFFSE